eukprot:6592614-Pyramimonas_sp.AAC.1
MAGSSSATVQVPVRPAVTISHASPWYVWRAASIRGTPRCQLEGTLTSRRRKTTSTDALSPTA